ncbi:zinc-binding dehydrogenase [Amycolatopsis carbonis]|uniref:Zinc-binding dehydrogenase n=1 Tax=Amycolatopsis carbonis TaxID=715471 RepID=A0A9Y2MTT3_9PSEU|nr:zinc-binding dehydrogenase [Amycolatopsis sp. 2-15]WIX77168.1 zinc-binding dehydrogenase [Amycolatopsis sp. 2-15]
MLGRDLVGRVAADAHGFRAGEWVWCNSLGHAGRQGAAAERAVVPADRLYRVPDGADPFAVVAMTHPAATAYLALVTFGRVLPGETVLVAGGGGNVGGALIELAAAAGARVFATAAAADLGHCRDLGAADAFDYRDERLPGKLASVGPVDLFVDTAGRNDREAAVRLLAWRGRIVLLAGARSRPVLPAGELYMHDRSVLGFAISNATVTELADAAAALNPRFAAGALCPRRVEHRTPRGRRGHPPPPGTRPGTRTRGAVDLVGKCPRRTQRVLRVPGRASDHIRATPRIARLRRVGVFRPPFPPRADSSVTDSKDQLRDGE